MPIINSHILIPKVVCKEFVNEQNYYYRYEVKSGTIAKGYPKKTFTEEDYYSTDLEKLLNACLETPLKTLLNFARSPNIESDLIVPNRDFTNIAWLYFKSLFARNPKMCQSISKSSFYFQFMSSQGQHDSTVVLTLLNPNMSTFIENFDFGFLINQTSIPFILPIRGIFEYKTNGIVCYSVPINPKVCLHFKEKGKSLLDNGYNGPHLIIPTAREEVIHTLNKFAFNAQQNDKFGCVISSNKDILLDLQNSL